MNTIKINGKNVTTFRGLKNELAGDGQGSGTLIGNVNIDGIDYSIRKHWSYSGGFPVFDSNGNQAGIIVLDNDESYCEGKYQQLYDRFGKGIENAELSFKKS